MAGLLIAGAFFIALFLALTLFIAFGLVRAADKMKSNNKDSELYSNELNGYYSGGPEGPGFYVDGQRVSYYDEDYD